MSIRPEDVIPDDANFVNYRGVTIRKGSAAAIFANASILENPNATDAEKEAALNAIRELMPAIAAVGVSHIMWKNPKLQKIMEEAAQKLDLT